MKILHFALLAPGSPQWGLRNALKALAGGEDNYREFDWHPLYREDKYADIHAGVIDLARNFQPDVCFLQIQTPGVLPGAKLDRLRSYCPFVMSWCGDLRQQTPAWAIDAAPHLDLHTFSNQRDVDAIRAKGYPAEFLNIGFSTDVFNPIGPTRPETPEIVFLGTNYADKFPRSYQRQQMVARLRARYGRRFAVHGNGWGDTDTFLTEADEAACYRSCKIAINQNHFDDVPRFSSDRILRAMGSGAFVLSNDWPGRELDFVKNKHVMVYNSLDDLEGLIDLLLQADNDVLRDVAAAGCEHVHQNHSWIARANQIDQFNARYRRNPNAD